MDGFIHFCSEVILVDTRKNLSSILLKVVFRFGISTL